MKGFLAYLLIFFVLATAVFGFMAMDDSMTNHTNCLAAISLGINCTQIFSNIDLAGMHSNFLAQFNTAVFAAGLALLALGLWFAFAESDLLQSGPFLQFKRIRREAIKPRRLFEFWFSLHENSPSLALGHA